MIHEIFLIRYQMSTIIVLHFDAFCSWLKLVLAVIKCQVFCSEVVSPMFWSFFFFFLMRCVRSWYTIYQNMKYEHGITLLQYLPSRYGQASTNSPLVQSTVTCLNRQFLRKHGDFPGHVGPEGMTLPELGQLRFGKL